MTSELKSPPPPPRAGNGDVQLLIWLAFADRPPVTVPTRLEFQTDTLMSNVTKKEKIGKNAGP
jgi:hypothetical protein